ncbi:tetratricopeptide repeat protein [Lentzea sp. HUAS12]|uniref:tetratricopeptide repeat protein n=1 Tax=Lentzea sp. HUAS12 TaxID=2951806 RepID=UPI0020A1D4F2|nr:tetratricopeptide repeat protein [Lentzea sp. HUAS12]USX53763.1 tetratricopeptide repeat protein [Lentzea sp. HUAS12]
MSDHLAAAVRRFRLRAGLTQEALAERSGVSVSTIRGVETGKRSNPQLTSVRQLAKALGLRPQEQEELLTSAGAGQGPPVRVPRQLPQEVPGFVGRADLLRGLDATLEDPGAAVVTVLSGTAGVGKTTLALHWAHRVADRFSDGQLYVDLRGFDPAGAVMAPGEALRMFLEALGVPPGAVPDELEAQTAMYRTLVAGRAMLLVLDNARDGAQVRPLLPGTPSSLVLVTSRSDLTGLIATTSARGLPLGLLSGDEAHSLLADRLGGARVGAEPAAVAEIIDRCAGLPLALAVVAARAAHTSFSLTAYAEELREGSLDGFDSGDEAADLRTIYTCSYQALSPAAARMFRLLGLHPATEIGLTAAASVAAEPIPMARRALQELVRAHMLIERTPGRFAFHDLLRVYAAEQVLPDERHDALHRLLVHYRYNAARVRALVRSMPMPAEELPPGVVAVEHADNDAAMAWLATETPVLLANARSAHGFPEEVFATIRLVVNILDSTGRLSGNTDVVEIGEAIAAQRGDRPGQAAMWKMTARLHMRQHRFDEAEAVLRTALEVDRESGDAGALGFTHIGLARIFSARDQHREAIAEARQAIEHFHEAGNSYAEAEALNGMAWCHAMLEEFDEATHHAERARALKKEFHPDVLDTLGYVEHRRGNQAAAIAHYLEALPQAETEGELYTVAEVLGHLGDAYEAIGQAEEAQRSRQRAVDLYEQLHSPLAEAVRDRMS